MPISITISAEKCISCGACVVLCPKKAIELTNGGAHVDPLRCSGCRICIYKCYARAIRIG